MKEIIEEIKKSRKVLLSLHLFPDGDSLGSNLALKLALEKRGKEVVLIQGNDPISKGFKFPGIEGVQKKSLAEVDLNDFDLFIIVDVSTLDRITRDPEIIFPQNLSTIHIDHHMDSENFAKFNWLDTSYSSTCDMIYELIKEMGIEIDHDIALNLFMGMYTDTGGFKYGTNVLRTFENASALVKKAPDYSKTIFIMENSNTKETLIFEGLALSSIKTFFEDRLAMVSVSKTELDKHNLTKENVYTGYISNKLKSVEGFEVAATLIEFEPGEIKISFRTRDSERYDLSKLAQALGGGGHKAAAAAILRMSIPEAVEKVAQTVKEIYNL